VSAPIEPKVVAASVSGALATLAVSGLADLVGAPLPAIVVQGVTAAVALVVAFGSGWWTKHAPRVDADTIKLVDGWMDRQPPTFHPHQVGTTSDGKPIIKAFPGTVYARPRWWEYPDGKS
jgi:hypothetical protein